MPCGSWSTPPRSRWPHAGVTADDIALVVPHQANIRIIAASCDRLGIGLDRASIVLDRTGNTSAASIPLALADALDAGRVTDGDLVLLVGFGAGMTSASAVVRWNGRTERSAATMTAATGRIVLVTGGSRGIGLACARRFADARRPGRRHLQLARRHPTGCSACSAT